MGLTIGLLNLTPSFDGRDTNYTATTTNASNKITAVAPQDSVILIEVNGIPVDNGSSASWNAGENTVTISVSEPGKAAAEYEVIVTKS